MQQPVIFNKNTGEAIRPMTYEELVQRLALAEAVCDAYDTLLRADRGSQESFANKLIEEAFKKWLEQMLEDNRW